MKHLLRTSTIVISLESSSIAAARCAYQPIEQTFEQAAAVFLGQVTGVQLETQLVSFDHPATFQITIRPLRVYKGETPEPQTFPNTILYHGPTIESAASPNAVQEMTLVEHEVNYTVGDLYFVFLRQGEKLSAGECSRSVQSFNKDVLRQIEGLAQ